MTVYQGIVSSGRRAVRGPAPTGRQRPDGVADADTYEVASTTCQKQADKRTKDSLRLRARFDGRLRKTAGQLLDALAGVNISTEIPLTQRARGRPGRDAGAAANGGRVGGEYPPGADTD